MNSMDNDSSLLRISVGYTLVDVTRTGEVSSIVSTERNQQRNWETLVQVLGLRAQLMVMSGPEILELDITNSQFGSDFRGKHLVWVFKFGVEHKDIFADDKSPYGTLETDFINVPIILGLKETAKIVTPMFVVSGSQRNIYFDSMRI
jgi:hypothetical protein